MKRVGASQPFYYFLLMKYEPFYVTYKTENSSFSDYGQNGENPQDTAKRIVLEKFGERPQFVRSLSFEDRIEISSIPSSISSCWPKGAKTIPHYIFTSLK